MNTRMAKKVAIVAVIIAAVASFRLLGIGEYLTLDYLKASQERLEELTRQHRTLMIAGYMVVYILATTLSVPGALILTLAGGALFGLWTGTIVVSFASTIGATLACIVSRFLLQDWVQSRFGDRLTAVNAGIEKEGAFYLFTLRLIPVFPFWMINLLMGLTRMPVRTYFWVSQLGMLPATIVFVNAGNELGRIESAGGLLSPRLLLSFILLGLFPLAARKAIGRYRSRKH